MRKQALLGCLICVTLFAGYLVLDSSLKGVVCAVCPVIWPLFAAYSSLLILAAIQHPRKFGCALYGFMLFVLSSVALFISGVRLLFSSADEAWPACDQSSLVEFSNLSYISKFSTLFSNRLPCQDELVVYGLTSTQLIVISAVLLLVFSLYLLMRKVDRNIFS